MKKSDAKYFIEVKSNSGCKLLSDYVNCKEKIKIQCACGKPFTTIFDSFKNKNKRYCNECSLLKKRLSYKDIEIYIKINAQGYVLLATEIRNKNGRNIHYIYVKCPIQEHPPYWINLSSFKHNRRCSKCYHEKRTNVPDKWKKEEILLLLDKYNLKIIDNTYKFNNAKEKIKCIDSSGYIVMVLVNSLIQGFVPDIFYGNIYALDNLRLLLNKNGLELFGTPSWKGVKNKYAAITKEGYKVDITPDCIMSGVSPKAIHKKNKHSIYNIQRFCQIYRPDYILISSEYKGHKELMTFKYIGNKISIGESERYFKVSPGKFICQWAGHPRIVISKGERKIESWLLSNNIKYKPEYKFKDCKDQNSLPFDFIIWNDDGSIKFLIEYQGIQHFEPVKYFGGEKKFLINKKHDKIKKGYCNNNNIRLVEIIYTDYDKVNIILDELFCVYENNKVA